MSLIWYPDRRQLPSTMRSGEFDRIPPIRFDPFSPGLRGISDGATTTHSCPAVFNCRWVQKPPPQSEACRPVSIAAVVHGGPEPQSAQEARSQEAAYEPRMTPRPSPQPSISIMDPSIAVTPVSGKVPAGSRSVWRRHARACRVGPRAFASLIRAHCVALGPQEHRPVA